MKIVNLDKFILNKETEYELLSILPSNVFSFYIIRLMFNPYYSELICIINGRNMCLSIDDYLGNRDENKKLIEIVSGNVYEIISETLF